MKKKKLVSLVLALAMCCSMLTGCMGEIAEVNINEDGSGTVKMSFGLTEEALDMMNSMSNEDGSTEGTVSDKDSMTAFEYNGVTYYGEVETVEFSSVAEFNELLKGDVSESNSDIDTGLIRLSQNADKSFTMVLETTSETGDTTAMEESIMSESSGMDDATAEMLLKDMAIVFSFTFPNDVKQITGPSSGVVIDGKTVTLDFIKMGEELNGKSTVYTFTTGNEVKVPIASFVDVPKNMWCYNSVMAMADGGLVAGVGNNKFNPNGTLTYGQFCTILARACSFETGELNGYWAGKAIESCIEAGYVKSLGEITQKNYDCPITREAAVSAMYLAGDLGEAVKEMTADQIPDYSEISAEFKDTILNAYNYGITNGMDSIGTFNPKGELTRGQICTLFYNLDWTTPIVKTISEGTSSLPVAGNN